MANRSCGVTGVTICTRPSLRLRARGASRRFPRKANPDDEPATPASRAARGSAAISERQQRIQVAHQRIGALWRGSMDLQLSENHGRRHAVGERCELARCTVVPSAIGSLKGTPISTTSQTPATAARLPMN